MLVFWKRSAAKATQTASTYTPDTIYYKSNKDAFDYACKYMNTEEQVDNIIPALVVNRVSPTKDGGQMCELLLASKDGGCPIFYADTLNDSIPLLALGDLVAYRIALVNPEFPRSSPLRLEAARKRRPASSSLLTIKGLIP